LKNPRIEKLKYPRIEKSGPVSKNSATLIVKALERFQPVHHFRQGRGHRLGLVDQIVQLRDLVLLLGILNHLRTNVIIIIFGDFDQFSAKNFLKTDDVIIYIYKGCNLSPKIPNFCHKYEGNFH
jgi:hypothetical protein